jgi:hypothetical protein
MPKHQSFDGWKWKVWFPQSCFCLNFLSHPKKHIEMLIRFPVKWITVIYFWQARNRILKRSYCSFHRVSSVFTTDFLYFTLACESGQISRLLMQFCLQNQHASKRLEKPDEAIHPLETIQHPRLRISKHKRWDLAKKYWNKKRCLGYSNEPLWVVFNHRSGKIHGVWWNETVNIVHKNRASPHEFFRLRSLDF